MQLITAFRYIPSSSMAFVGAGGKTTAIFKAARELLGASDDEQAARTVLVTTSTHFGVWQTEYADHFLKISSLSDIARLEVNLPNGVVLLTGDASDILLSGLSPKLLEKVNSISKNHHLPLLIEADGAHTCHLKAPAEHEPAIPEFSENVVVVAGLLGLGKPLGKNWVHRPQRFAELSDLRMGDLVTSEALSKVMLNTAGGLKNIPSSARRIALLNQADTPELLSAGKTISEKLVNEYNSIVIASLAGEKKGFISDEAHTDGQGVGIHAVVEKIAGIILAAGGSSRFGEPKQLLLWQDVPLIRHVAINALKAGLSPVIVIVGSTAEGVEAVLNDLPLRIVNNPEWVAGISSSIKTGLVNLPKDVGGIVFLQADQPHIPPTLIKSLIEAHEATLSPIIAPQIDGQRGNPVLFDTCTFSKLQSLEGDIGGRALFGRFHVQWIPWHDQNLLLDIDSPEDYEKFLRIYSEDEEKT